MNEVRKNLRKNTRYCLGSGSSTVLKSEFQVFIKINYINYLRKLV